jgi:hypothetical protein
LSDQEVLSKSYDYFPEDCAASVHGSYGSEECRSAVPLERTSLEDFYDKFRAQDLVHDGFLAKDAKQQK